MQHTTVSGTIRYISRKPEHAGRTRGVEHFVKTLHTDGGVTMRSLSQLEIPEPRIVRDVIQSYDPQGRVTDIHLRVSVADKLIGTAWYWADRETLHLEAWGPQIGRVSDAKAFGPEIQGVGTHPIVCDGYMLKAFDRSRGPRKAAMTFHIVSPDHRGATPPVIATVRVWVEYVGEEITETAVGPLETHHFRYTDDGASGLDGQHPDIDVWVTRDHFIYCRGEIGGYFMSAYSLESLEITPPSA